MAKKLKVKTTQGKLVDYSSAMVKKVLAQAGMTGRQLLKTASYATHEAKKMAKKGVITAGNVEKAVVRAVQRTHLEVVSSSKRLTKTFLGKKKCTCSKKGCKCR